MVFILETVVRDPVEEGRGMLKTKGRILKSLIEECVVGHEKCWWENGTPKRFSSNLITLAEKLGFNVERFSKITGPSNSAG